jgi:hypothetical protein
MVRGLSLCISVRPKTPLRVLCIVAFDTLHMLRNAKPLPRRKLRVLAALLDFEACANAVFDNKPYCLREWHETLQLLEEAGLRWSLVEYLRRLEELECTRPLPGGNSWHFQEVSSYREAVVRLALGMLATAADHDGCLDAGIRATQRDGDLRILFRIAMLCQIIDDVLDYSRDVTAGLPSFLTASRSLPQAFALTSLAALRYADGSDLPRTGDAVPLRLALFFVAGIAKLLIVLGRWRQGAGALRLASDSHASLGSR